MGALARNTLLMTAAGIVLRCVGLSYQIWLAESIGQAGIGLFQLIGTVNMFCATLAISGIRFATTRLVSEEIGLGRAAGVGSAVEKCLVYAVCFGTLAFMVMFFGAQRIGFLWIGDARTVLSLKTLSISMPMLALGSVFSGFFIATARVWHASAIQIAEQLINIFSAFMLLQPGGDIEHSCAAIARSNVIADSCSLALSAIVYFIVRPRETQGFNENGLGKRMLGIALPLAFSAYARTALTSLMNLMVPRKLRVSGLSAERALAGYGIIGGMVFPIISFPSCLLSAAAELSISHLTAAQMQDDGERIRKTVKILLSAAGLFSLVIALLLFFFSEILGVYIYKSLEAGRYIRLFALLVPIMYMDIVTDGCLKGLGQMNSSMRYNICEAALGLIFVMTLVPRWGLGGYIFVLFFCEGFNFTLSMRRLLKVCGMDKRRTAVIAPYGYRKSTGCG